MNATRRKATHAQPTIATPRQIVAGSTTGTYVPQWGPMRTGAEDALKLPSRMGKRLTYRDGREEKL
jgi:hypothetical protein